MMNNKGKDQGPVFSKYTVLILALNIFINTVFCYISQVHLLKNRDWHGSIIIQASLYLFQLVLFIGIGSGTNFIYAELMLYALRKYSLLLGNGDRNLWLWSVMGLYLAHLGICMGKKGYILNIIGVTLALVGNINYGIFLFLLDIILQIFRKKLNNKVVLISLLLHCWLIPCLSLEMIIISLTITILSIWQMSYFGLNLQVGNKFHWNVYVLVLGGGIMCIFSHTARNLQSLWYIFVVIFLVLTSLDKYNKTIYNFIGGKIYENFQQYSTEKIKKNEQVQLSKNLNIVSIRKSCDILSLTILYVCLIVSCYLFNPIIIICSLAIVFLHPSNSNRFLAFQFLFGYLLGTIPYFHYNLITLHINYPTSVTRYLKDHTCHMRNYWLFFIQFMIGGSCLVLLIFTDCRILYRQIRFGLKVMVPIWLIIEVWNMGCLTIHKIMPILCLFIGIINSFKAQPLKNIQDQSDNQDNSEEQN